MPRKAEEYGSVAAVNPYAAAGLFALDTVSGAMAAGEEDKRRSADQALRWEEIMAQLNQRRSEQGDDRGKFAAHLSSTQAMQPLADRGFSALQARFAQGPGTFGQIGNQNRQMQQTAQSYRPGQNPSMQQYGSDLETLKQRFMSTPPPVGGRMLGSQPNGPHSGFSGTPDVPAPADGRRRVWYNGAWHETYG